MAYDLAKQLNSSVRLWNATGPVGTGFLVDERHFMTCAHVVADALGDRKRYANAACPAAPVSFDFACDSRQLGSLLKATPLPAAWHPQDGPAKPSDVAVLEIEPGVSLPNAARPVEICPDTRTDHSCSAYVIKKGLLQGTHVRGTFAGDISDERTEILADRIDVAVAPGCSGAALWNKTTGGVAGMIVEMHTQTQGRIIRIERLRQVWPSLPEPAAWTNNGFTSPQHAPRPETTRLRPRLARMLHTFDRGPQSTEFEMALDLHWEERNRPVVCAVLGAAEDLPLLYRDRCIGVSLPQRLERLEIGKPPARKKIDWWSPVERGVPYALARLVHQVRSELKAKDSSPAAIRKAYNEGVTPWAFYSLVQERDFTPQHRDLLVEWARFWREVGEEKLNKPLAVLLLCQSNEANGPSFLDPIFEEFGATALADVEALPRLHDFTVEEVKDWLVERADELGLSQVDLEDQLVPELKNSSLSSGQKHRLATLEAWIDRLTI